MKYTRYGGTFKAIKARWSLKTEVNLFSASPCSKKYVEMIFYVFFQLAVYTLDNYSEICNCIFIISNDSLLPPNVIKTASTEY